MGNTLHFSLLTFHLPENCMNKQYSKDLKIGIALSGGVVRGFAHIGVLDVLEEEGLDIGIVGGASAGALIGYSYAAGMKIGRIHEMADRLAWWRLAQPVWPRSGLVTFQQLEDWLVDNLGDLHFSDLARTFVVMTSDIDTGEAFAITRGRVAPAVRASCSVPGFVEPVRHLGRRLVDGAVTNNLPTKAVRHLGADYVIGVDILKHGQRRLLGPLGTGIAAVELMVEHSGSGMENAECIIRPNLEAETYIDFRKRERLIELGRKAAVASLPEIYAELGALSEEKETLVYANRKATVSE